MKLIRILCVAAVSALLLFQRGVVAQAPADMVDGFRMVEVASVSDAIEQLYGQRAYLSHDMRPVFKTKFAGPAVTVLLKKEEHTEGSKASQGMLDAIDSAAPGSVYVMVLDGDGLDYAGIDFGLSAEGNVLVFEANATMVVNPPEPDERWAYRRPAVERVFAAVRRMLKAHIPAAP